MDEVRPNILQSLPSADLTMCTTRLVADREPAVTWHVAECSVASATTVDTGTHGALRDAMTGGWAWLWGGLLAMAMACEGKERAFGPAMGIGENQANSPHEDDSIDAGSANGEVDVSACLRRTDIELCPTDSCPVDTECVTYDDSDCASRSTAAGAECDNGRGQCDGLGRCIVDAASSERDGGVGGRIGIETQCLGCVIAGICTGAGALSSNNVCLICDPKRNSGDWSANDGAACDDGLFCTTDDVCSDGNCGGEVRSCEDEVDCNGISTCDEATESCAPNVNQCGLDSICDVLTDRCVSTCAGCLIGGVCLPPGAELAGNPCMVCDPGRSAAAFAPAIGKSCGASPSACSQQDTCDNQGRCQPNHLAATTPCGDSTSSTCDQADSCDGNGNCLQRLAPNGTACDDGAFCSSGDRCQGGACIATGLRTCGANQSCNEAANECQCQPGPRNCTSPLDNDCDGRPDNTIDTVCICVIGQTQVCGDHPGLDGNGPCRAGQRRCEAGPNNSSSSFGACTGSVGPQATDSCLTIGDDANCNGTENDACECIAGRGNGPCSADPNNSRCSNQGRCVPCQTDADCSLVTGDRTRCDSGECIIPIIPARLVGTTTVDPPRAPLAGEQLIIYVDDSISGAVLTVTFTASATNAAAIVSEINAVTAGRVIASSTAGHIALTTVEAGAGVFLSVYDTAASSILGLQGLGTAEGESR